MHEWSCIIIAHKKMADLAKISTAGLRARRRQLGRALLKDPEAALFGTLVTQGRRCGKQGCQCREGELHGPYLYVALRKPRGKGRLLYVPAELAEAVRRRIAVTTRVEAALEEISAINLELLSRRKLD